MMDILAPDFEPLKFIKYLQEQPNDIRQAGENVLQLYKTIEEYTGYIERYDVVNEIKNPKAPKRKIKVPYIPNAKHDAWFRAESRIRAFTGGNRIGKSTCGAKEAVSWCIGFRPWLKRSDPAFRTPQAPPVDGLIVCEDWKWAAKTVIVDKLYQNIPPELLVGKPKKQENGVEYLWRVKVPFDATGKISTLQIVTNNTDSKSLEGPDWQFAWLDEPPRRDIWIAITRGLIDAGGSAWFTMTPLEEPWVKNEIIDRDGAFSTEMSQYENIYDPETGSGALTNGRIEEYIKGLSEHEIQMRVWGRFSHLVGAIFKKFNRETHVIDPFQVPDHWPRAIFLDTHPRKPHAAGLVTWDVRKGRMFLIDAFRWGDQSYSRGSGRDFADVFDGAFEDLLVKLNEWMDPAPYIFLVDPLAKEKDMITGDDLFGKLMGYFPVDTWEKTKNKKNTIFHFHDMMDIDEATGGSNFYVFNTLPRPIFEIENYRWGEHKGALKDSRDPKDEPVKKDDDFVDILLTAAQYPPPEFEMTLPEYNEEDLYFNY